jgi:hypothetical protein
MKRFPLLILLTANLWCATKLPPPEILGIRLGMAYSQAHAKLTQIGQFKNEDEGQEVWALRSDPHYQTLIVGFDRDRRVRYVTVLASPQGKGVDYNDVADVHSATSSGQPGNLVFTWKAHDPKSRMEYLAVAKGSDPHRLASYSVKRVMARNEEEEEERK